MAVLFTESQMSLNVYIIVTKLLMTDFHTFISWTKMHIGLYGDLIGIHKSPTFFHYHSVFPVHSQTSEIYY